MKGTRNIRQSIIDLNFGKLEHELQKHSGVSELEEKVVEIIKNTGCLLIHRDDTNCEKRRDTFQNAIAEWLRKSDAINALKIFREHTIHAGLCQRAFRQVLLTLAESPIGQASPSVAASATFFAASSKLNTLYQAVSKYQKDMTSAGSFFLSPECMRVGNSKVNPDLVAEELAFSLGGYLKMLGYQNDWFEDGFLKLPHPIEVPEKLRNNQAILYLAEVWNQLEFQ